MNNKDFFKLTDTIYNITEFISDESLKNKIRERALEVFSNLNLIFSENPKATSQEKSKLSVQIEKDIEVLENCLKLACSREYLYPFNFLIIKNEYNKIKEILKEYEKSEERTILKKQEKKLPPKNFLEERPEELSPSISEHQLVSERQKKILEVLEKKEKAQVCNFREFLPDVSKRTLRRDLDNLLKKELIIRVGNWNQIFYQLKEGRTGGRTEGRTKMDR